MARAWTEEEDEYIRNHYQDLTYDEMAYHLKRTYNAVQTHITKKLGLKKFNQRISTILISKEVYARAEANGIRKSIVNHRIRQYGYSEERAVTEPVRKYEIRTTLQLG